MTDYTHWHVGMKVVCIADPTEWDNKAMNLPRKDAIYTIRTLEADRYGTFIRLMEIANAPMALCGIEPDFCCSGFRPIVSRPTDISCFTAMLDQKHVRSPERVGS